MYDYFNPCARRCEEDFCSALRAALNNLFDCSYGMERRCRQCERVRQCCCVRHSRRNFPNEDWYYSAQYGAYNDSRRAD